MSGSRFAFGRPIRWLALLICAGGIALAMERSWTDPIRTNRSFLDWISLMPLGETASLGREAMSAPITPSRSAISTSEFLHAIPLFSPPSTGWRLTNTKTELTSAWLEQQSTPTVADTSGYSLPAAFFSAGFVSPSIERTGPVPLDPNGGPVGTWISLVSGNWSTPSNWSSNSVPSGANVMVHFDALNITSTVTVTLDTSRTIGHLSVGDTNGTDRYDIAPGAGTILTFNNSGNASSITQVSTSAGDTISVPLLVKNDLDVNNASTAHPLQITGSIASSGTAGTLQNLRFNSGAVNISGDISNGSTGAIIRIHVDGGVLNLSGHNTYTGMTFVSGGTLFVKGDNSGATGTVQVSGTGSVLSGIGTVGGNVTIFGGTITGGDTTSTGRLTLNQNVSIFASEGGGGTYLANLDGDTSDLLAIGGNLSIGNGTTLDIHGTADGITTYILATFAGGGLSGQFDFVTGLPADYTLVYTSSDIELVPTAVPEPATWIGGALALGAMAFAQRRRLRGYWLSVIGQ